ncbi:hypothetical protein Tco_0787938 [Tanacetum coccineum]
MSDSDESGVTTRSFQPNEGLSDIGSLESYDHDYLDLLGYTRGPIRSILEADPEEKKMRTPERSCRFIIGLRRRREYKGGFIKEDGYDDMDIDAMM